MTTQRNPVPAAVLQQRATAVRRLRAWTCLRSKALVRLQGVRTAIDNTASDEANEPAMLACDRAWRLLDYCQRRVSKAVDLDSATINAVLACRAGAPPEAQPSRPLPDPCPELLRGLSAGL